MGKALRAADPDARVLERLAEAEPGTERRKPKQNKLVFKNRWLVARDVVAALQRAGVSCDIIIPEYVWWRQ